MIEHFANHEFAPLRQNGQIQRTFCGFILMMLVVITGCDGGIFGTGDGDDPIITVPGDTAQDVTADPSTPDGMGMSPDVVELSIVTADTVGSFNNAEVTSARSDAQLKIINASPDQNLSLLAINNNMVEMPLVPLPGLSTTTRDSGYLVINNPGNAITLFAAAEVVDENYTNPLASIDPVTLASGTSTTLLLRGIPEDLETPIEILAIGNQTRAADETALVRAAHAATNILSSVDIILESTTTDATEETVLGAAFNYQSGITRYTSLATGSYNLIIRDTNDPDRTLVEPTAITLADNEVITLILLDRTAAGEAGMTILRSQDSSL